MNSLLSSFTPSMLSSETLEALFVQRESLAERTIELVRDSVTTPAKHHILLAGPRGIGKTHLVSLVYHRLKAMEDTRGKLLIAWLREEEWGVTGFRDVLVRMLKAVLDEGEVKSSVDLVESLFNLPPADVERVAARTLREVVGNRTLLLVVENLDELFGGLGDLGQKRFRAFVQETGFLTILATCQSLFSAVTRRASPFFGFFQVEQLEELTLEDATKLLINIARFQGNEELAALIATPFGRARIRSVHHLAGGNHRVYVLFSQFLTRGSLDELVGPVMKTIDDLTPYYQSRMSQVSLQQRKLLEILCEKRGAVPVRELAKRGFVTHQTASGQLRVLREKGYVRGTPIGRDVYYELREPLMRLCVEVKKHRGEPVRVLVDFLRLWYSATELEQRLSLLHPEAIWERQYVLTALEESKSRLEDPRLAACSRDYEIHVQGGSFEKALTAAEDLAEVRGETGDWDAVAHCLAHLGRWEEALKTSGKAIALDGTNAAAWAVRSWALMGLGHLDEALESEDKALSLKSDEEIGWSNRGELLVRLGRYEEAVESFEKSLALKKTVTSLEGQARALAQLKRIDEAIGALDRAIELAPSSASYWISKGRILADAGRNEEALTAFDRAISIDPRSPAAWEGQGVVSCRLGKIDEEIESFRKVVELAPKDAGAWRNLAMSLSEKDQTEAALGAVREAVELDPKQAAAWHLQGVMLWKLGQIADSLSALDRAIEFGDECPTLLLDRVVALVSLGRWLEGLRALDSGLARAGRDGGEPAIETEAIVTALLKGREENNWRERMEPLVQIYGKHRMSAVLSQAIARSIVPLRSERDRDFRRGWYEAWRDVGQTVAELDIAFRLLRSAVEYLDTQDMRAILELSEEERKLLEPLIGLSDKAGVS